MGGKISPEDRAQTRAEQAFKSAERRDVTSKQITETERATVAAKTKKLRALRLAKEAADVRAAEDDPANRRKRR